MQYLLFLIIVFWMGASTSIYLPMNGVVAKHVGSALLANIPFYILGAITTIVLFLLSNNASTVSRLEDVPSHLYLSGIMSAFLVLGSTFFIPKLGTGTFFVLFVAGQVVMAVAVSHFGWLASPRDPITLRKLLGLSLLMAGVVLTTSR